MIQMMEEGIGAAVQSDSQTLSPLNNWAAHTPEVVHTLWDGETCPPFLSNCLSPLGLNFLICEMHMIFFLKFSVRIKSNNLCRVPPRGWPIRSLT